MARRTSAAALHAARVILHRYDIALHPTNAPIAGMLANEKHLAVLIDYTTQAYEVALVRPELRYWHIRMRDGTATAPQLAQYMRRMVEALDKIPGDVAPGLMVQGDTPAGSDTVKWLSARPRRPQLILHEYAIKTARAINWYYVVTPKVAPLIADEELEFLHLAKLVEISVGLSQALKARPLLRDAEIRMRQGQMTEDECSDCLRGVGVYFEQMPHFEDMRDETLLLV
jgi:hypothetical protein